MASAIDLRAAGGQVHRDSRGSGRVGRGGGRGGRGRNIASAAVEAEVRLLTASYVFLHPFECLLVYSLLYDVLSGIVPEWPHVAKFDQV